MTSARNLHHKKRNQKQWLNCSKHMYQLRTKQKSNVQVPSHIANRCKLIGLAVRNEANVKTNLLSCVALVMLRHGSLLCLLCAIWLQACNLAAQIHILDLLLPQLVLQLFDSSLHSANLINMGMSKSWSWREIKISTWTLMLDWCYAVDGCQIALQAFNHLTWAYSIHALSVSFTRDKFPFARHCTHYCKWFVQL